MRMSAGISSDLGTEVVEHGYDCTYPGSGVVASWCGFDSFYGEGIAYLWRFGELGKERPIVFHVLIPALRIHWRMYYSEQKHRT